MPRVLSNSSPEARKRESGGGEEGGEERAGEETGDEIA